MINSLDTMTVTLDQVFALQSCIRASAVSGWVCECSCRGIVERRGGRTEELQNGEQPRAEICDY